MDGEWLEVEEKGFNPYFIGLPILIQSQPVIGFLYSLVSILILLDYLFLFWYKSNSSRIHRSIVSILILLDYLFLLISKINLNFEGRLFQSLFYWITYSYFLLDISILRMIESFNPYFIGLPILIK